MNHELMDMLDETIQDLDEAGLEDIAEQLYAIAYDTEWPSEQELVEEIGREILRVQARRGEEIPKEISNRMARCLEIVRRMRPDMLME
jgi:hypothetical protein